MLNYLRTMRARRRMTRVILALAFVVGIGTGAAIVLLVGLTRGE